MALRVDPYSLQLFRLVADARSFAKAAGYAHLDPTSLGRRIKRLEVGLKTALLVRGPGGLSLTEAGRRLYARAGDIERTLDAIAAEIGNPSGALHGSLRVAANPSSMLALMPEVLVAMRERHPGIAIQLIESPTPEVVRLCATGAADVGVGTDYRRVTGVHRRRLLDDRLVLVVPVGHALAVDRPVRFAEAVSWPQVVTEGGVLDHVLYRQARALRHEVHAAVVVRSYDVTFRMVEAGLGVAVLPALALRGIPGDERFVVRALAESWGPRAVWAYTRWRSPPDRASGALLEALRTIAGSGADR